MTALPPMEQSLEEHLRIRSHHLAQVNVARLRAPLDAPETAEFKDNLRRINQLAEMSHGFVWRLADEQLEDATMVRIWNDPMVLVNMSLWRSLERLKAFAYVGEHVEFVRRRAEWFEPMDRPHQALWWVKPGRAPSVEEAAAKLDLIRDRGPGPEAFSFAKPFGPDGAPLEAPLEAAVDANAG